MVLKSKDVAKLGGCFSDEGVNVNKGEPSSDEFFSSKRWTVRDELVVDKM